MKHTISVTHGSGVYDGPKYVLEHTMEDVWSVLNMEDLSWSSWRTAKAARKELARLKRRDKKEKAERRK